MEETDVSAALSWSTDCVWLCWYVVLLNMCTQRLSSPLYWGTNSTWWFLWPAGNVIISAPASTARTHTHMVVCRLFWMYFQPLPHCSMVVMSVCSSGLLMSSWDTFVLFQVMGPELFTVYNAFLCRCINSFACLGENKPLSQCQCVWLCKSCFGLVSVTLDAEQGG